MDERDPVAVELSFPLTLTLSLGEREQPARPMFSAHWLGKLSRRHG